MTSLTRPCIRKLALEPDRESYDKGGAANSRSDTHNSSVTFAAMLPQAAQLADSCPPENQAAGQGMSDVTGRGGASSRGNPTPGHVTYLRKCYADKRISGEATDLLLVFWRQKSAQLYDCLCKRWIGWCTVRDLDPLSEPIEEAINCLAHLHTEGYQY